MEDIIRDHDIYSLKELVTTKDDITDDLISLAIKYSNIVALDHIKEVGGPFVGNMFEVAETGDVEVLKWMEENCSDWEIEDVLVAAVDNGHIDFLDAWIKTNFDCQIDGFTLQNASTEVLDWWKESGLDFVCDEDILTEETDIDVLDWWLNSGLDISKMYDVNMDLNDIEDEDLREWWERSNLLDI